MATTRRDGIRVVRIKKGDDLATIYAKVRRAFTAADLQKYTVIEEGVPMAQVLAELSAINKEEKKKKRKK